VNHDFPGEPGDQRFEFVRFESLRPANPVIFAPRHPGPVGIGFVAGVEGFTVGADIGRAY
jgi:hypothetical protein